MALGCIDLETGRHYAHRGAGAAATVVCLQLTNAPKFLFLRPNVTLVVMGQEAADLIPS